MRKLFLTLLLSLCLISNGFCVSEWDKTKPAGTPDAAADLDVYIQANNEALDRYFAYGRYGCKLSYASASTITIAAGGVVCSSSTNVRHFRANSTATTFSWTLDTGSEAASSTYYLYANGDADTATFTVIASLSSTTPTGVTYYKRLGSFYNDVDSNITQIVDDAYPVTTLGIWTSKSEDTVYQASTDGFVLAYLQNESNLAADAMVIYSDSSNPPTTLRAATSPIGGTTRNTLSIMSPVKKGNYYKVTTTGTSGAATVYWIPLQLE